MRVNRPIWIRTGFGVGERSRFFFVDLDLERLRESTERETEGFLDFFDSSLRRSFNFWSSLEPVILYGSNSITCLYTIKKLMSYLMIRIFIPLLLCTETLLVRFKFALFSRLLSLLDDDDELELDEEVELEELERDSDDELLSDEL